MTKNLYLVPQTETMPWCNTGVLCVSDTIEIISIGGTTTPANGR